MTTRHIRVLAIASATCLLCAKISAKGSSDIAKTAGGMTYSLSAYTAGRADALRDLKKGILAIESYGLITDFTSHRIYRQILWSRYGITIRTVAGCEPDDIIFGHAKGYNEVSQAEITRRYGRNLLEKVSSEADKLHAGTSHR